jgi:hypothetical protein
MDCRTAQEHILEGLDAGALAAELHVHVAACQTCAAFLSAQASLDSRLSRALVSPQLSPRFRVTLRSRMAVEHTSWLRDALPDIFHFISWGLATAVCALFLSLDPALVFVTGAATALSTYVLLTVLRSTFEGA